MDKGLRAIYALIADPILYLSGIGKRSFSVRTGLRTGLRTALRESCFARLVTLTFANRSWFPKVPKPWKPSWKPIAFHVAPIATIHAAGFPDSDLSAGKFVRKLQCEYPRTRRRARLSAH
jgi:hypothetical protein